MPGDRAAEPFAARVRRLAKEQGKSVERLAMEAWDPEIPGTSAGLLKQVLQGRRTLHLPLIEAVAHALGVAPEEFPEYRLGLARRQLDETEVGLDQALTTLEQIEKALRPRQAASRLEAERTQASADQQRAGRPARRSPRAS